MSPWLTVGGHSSHSFVYDVRATAAVEQPHSMQVHLLHFLAFANVSISSRAHGYRKYPPIGCRCTSSATTADIGHLHDTGHHVETPTTHTPPLAAGGLHRPPPLTSVTSMIP
eukprot:1137565-Pelagomonas_calceolata.AAC.3